MTKPVKYLLISILTIAFSNFLIAGAIYYIRTLYQLPRFWDFVLIFIGSIIAGAVVVFATLGTTPILKDLINTYRRLLRLENLSHPLLVRLSSEAPGTYHHSLTVAALAHNAAKEIGADALLARVGGYYHDIGKLKNSQIFTENTPSSPPPNNLLASQIALHISSGIEIAAEYNLPPEVGDFIAQHHGTTKVSYFGEGLRYPGPKPLSKETGIAMLADAAEARSRTISRFTEEEIQKIVDEIIASRLEENQLILSELTAKDLTKIRLSFAKTLKSMFHDRIKYPKEKVKR